MASLATNTDSCLMVRLYQPCTDTHCYFSSDSKTQYLLSKVNAVDTIYPQRFFTYMHAGTIPDLGAPQPNYHYLYRLGQFTIQQYFESSLIPLLNDIQIQWYHNGTAVDDLRTNSSLESQGERLTLSLTVFNASEEMDLGLYEGTANVDVSNFYSIGCPRYYYYYYYARYDISIYQLRVASFLSVILQYGKHF